MGLRRIAASISITSVAAVSIFMGVNRRAEALATRSSSLRAAPVELAPVVVNARRPSLAEIVDLILHERPTAAQLGAATGAPEFPKGSEEAHVAGVLTHYSRNTTLVDEIASAIVKEGRRRHIGSSLLVGVLLTENPDLDPRATSSVGARGLMQVMPFHAGKWGCGSRDLFDVESNICHGVAVLADNLSGARSLPQALLSYNGCVRGTNTPDCRKYPRIVYKRARKGEDSTSGAFVQ
jgi:hypothetical protein